jgi:hypothetical protein
MAALGHKRTFAVHQPTSALLLIATAKADSRNRSCLLYAVQLGMLALGQKRTLARDTGAFAKSRTRKLFFLTLPATSVFTQHLYK